jgi:hypothetical protein
MPGRFFGAPFLVRMCVEQKEAFPLGNGINILLEEQFYIFWNEAFIHASKNNWLFTVRKIKMS